MKKLLMEEILVEDILDDLTNLKRFGINKMSNRDMERFIDDTEIKVKRLLELVNNGGN